MILPGESHLPSGRDHPAPHADHGQQKAPEDGHLGGNDTQLCVDRRPADAPEKDRRDVEPEGGGVHCVTDGIEAVVDCGGGVGKGLGGHHETIQC